MSLCYGMKDGQLRAYHQEDDEEYDELGEEMDDEEEDSEEEGIILSEKHGLNPSMDVCMICGEVHQLVLLGKLPEDREAPKQVCTGQVCQKCISQLVENKERLYIECNNVPTGRYGKVPDEYLKEEYLQEIGDRRVFYIPSEHFIKVFTNESGTNTTDD